MEGHNCLATNMQVNILSGLPGSGKSYHLRKHRQPGDIVLSADIVMGPIFKGYRLPEIHQSLIREYVALMERGGAKTVWIDNTNVSAAEIAPYYTVGKAFGAEVDILRFIPDPRIASARKVHAVSPETFQKMQQKLIRLIWEEINGFVMWKPSQIFYD